jgi:hypothetical protein
VLINGEILLGDGFVHLLSALLLSSHFQLTQGCETTGFVVTVSVLCFSLFWWEDLEEIFSRALQQETDTKMTIAKSIAQNSQAYWRQSNLSYLQYLNISSTLLRNIVKVRSLES